MSTDTISPVNISTTSKTMTIIATEELVLGEGKTAVEIPRLKLSMILCKITYFHSD